ncbi:MAG: hypothetical protein NZM00_00610, partial [Anaerolinea sp.]|nr:hypothetical protein [Anaerolinea sp.]
RAVEVWNGNPFWEIRDGKIINHWLIAAFDPRHAPDFVGRIATVLVGAIGLAGSVALTGRAWGATAALLAGALWIASPYLFFYERLAFSDAEAGAWIVVALAAALRFNVSGRLRHAGLAGIALTLAGLFKFTALPFALLTGLTVLLPPPLPGSPRPPQLRARLIALAIMAGIGAAAFAVPVLVLLLRGAGLFDIAAGWIGAGSTAGGTFGPLSNLERLIVVLLTFGSPLWSAALIVGLGALIVFTPGGRRLTLYAALPLAAIIILGREVLPRHYVVALPLALTLGGAGLAILIRRTPARLLMTAAVISALAIGFAPFALVSYCDPAAAALPQPVHAEHISDHSAGYALREAVRSLSMHVPVDAHVIGSFFPDSCRRANFYAVPGYALICTDAPGIPAIEAALTASGTVFVLTDSAPIIGLDVPAFAAEHGLNVERIAAYARPGDAEPTVVLWRIAR